MWQQRFDLSCRHRGALNVRADSQREFLIKDSTPSLHGPVLCSRCIRNSTQLISIRKAYDLLVATVGNKSGSRTKLALRVLRALGFRVSRARAGAPLFSSCARVGASSMTPKIPNPSGLGFELSVLRHTVWAFEFRRPVCMPLGKEALIIFT